MDNYVLHKADSRGNANHGWLDARHTFSFANYYDPARMHFGVLRVLNDDKIAGGKGFGTHPHDNMEIITIPLSGALAHKDSMGNSSVISKGEIQVMSAGTGIHHSEFNHNPDQEVKLLQIWLFPNKRNVQPRYDQIAIQPLSKQNAFYQILSPSEDDQGVWIHQDAWFHLGDFDKGHSATYQVKRTGNGVYAFVIRGSFEIDGIQLGERDGLGISDLQEFKVTALADDAELLLMDVPMQLPRL